MARGIGTLTVSVQGNTAKAIKNIRDFRGEMKSAGVDARRMAADFKGNTIADYENRFGPKPADVLRVKEEVTGFQHSLVDLRKDTDRYNVAAMRQVGVVKQLNMAMNSLKAVGKAASVAFVAVEGFRFGQAIRGHLEYIQSWSDAWRELKSVVGQAQSGYDAEMEKLAKQDARNAGRIARMDAQIQAEKDRKRQLEEERAASKADLKRQLDVATLGENEVLYREDVAKFGLSTASINAARRDQLQTIEDNKATAAAKEEARQKKEKDHYDNLRADALSIQKVRERVADHGKTSLQAERDQLLRTIEDVKQRGEAKEAFRRLEELEASRTAIEAKKKERDQFAGRTGQDSAILDARTTEGWAALRNSVRSAELQKLDEQIAVLKAIEGKVGAPAKEEVFTL